jgi:hypothetical protein
MEVKMTYTYNDHDFESLLEFDDKTYFEVLYINDDSSFVDQANYAYIKEKYKDDLLEREMGYNVKVLILSKGFFALAIEIDNLLNSISDYPLLDEDTLAEIEMNAKAECLADYIKHANLEVGELIEAELSDEKYDHLFSDNGRYYSIDEKQADKIVQDILINMTENMVCDIEYENRHHILEQCLKLGDEDKVNAVLRAWGMSNLEEQSIAEAINECAVSPTSLYVLVKNLDDDVKKQLKEMI